MNAFTDLSRDARLSIGVPGLCDKLRAPEVLATMVKAWKPATVSLGDHLLACLLDRHIDDCQSRQDYREIQRTLDTLFGAVGDTSPDGVTAVPSRDSGHRNGRS